MREYGLVADISPQANTLREEIVDMAGQQWFIESRGARLLSVAGENYYKDELKQTLGGEEETEFTAELRRERSNPHDTNATAVYRVGGGMVGHLWRDAAERWAPVIDAIESHHGATVSCRAVAGRHIDDGKAGVFLHISLQDLRRELQRRDACVSSRRTGRSSRLAGQRR